MPSVAPRINTKNSVAFSRSGAPAVWVKATNSSTNNSKRPRM
jgi:hypothetical protein